MVMRFHHEMAVGHPEPCPGSRAKIASRDQVDPGSPMQVDPLSEPSSSQYIFDERSTDSDEDSIVTRADDSEDSGLCDPEPDSEVESNIYD